MLKLPAAAVEQLALVEASHRVAMADYKAIAAIASKDESLSDLSRWMTRHPHLHQYIHLLKAARQLNPEWVLGKPASCPDCENFR